MTETDAATRERKKYRQHQKEGKCSVCDKPAIGAYCRKHGLLHKQSRRRADGCKPWEPGGRGRPPIYKENGR